MVTHRRGWEAAATSTARHGRLTLARRRSLVGFLFVLPGIVPLLIFVVYPMLSALYLSFTNWALMGAPHVQGLSTYTNLFADQQFRTSLIVTLEVASGPPFPSACSRWVPHC